jgi:SAM-dependent methyltransferase
MNFLRPVLRRFCFTFNTIRYRTEWPCLERALRRTPRSGVIFDGGAGSGEFLRRSLALGFSRGVALEYDEQNFHQLQMNAGRDPRVQLMRESLLAIPLPVASVDVVMSTQVIEHIKEHETAASELCRILKPGGYAVITVPRPPEPFPNPDHVREGYTETQTTNVEPLGSHDIVDLQAGTETLRARCASGFVHGEGAKVWMAVDPHRVHFFDAASGNSLRGAV